MKRLLLSLIVSSCCSSAQQWADLGTGSRLSSVSPSNCTNSTPPSYCAGLTFAYADNFAGVMTAWSSAAARTKAGSEQLLIFGGGHVSTFDNSVYAVNLTASPVTVTALTTPSIPTGLGSPVTTANISCTSPNADGTPLSSHTYGQMVYLPVADKLFYWEDGAGNYCATASSRKVWLFDLTSHTWADANPSGVAGFNINSGSDAQYAFCALDPTTAHETVICQWGGNNMLLRYDATANTWERLTTNGSFAYPQAAVLAVDPVRQILLVLGTVAFNGTGGLQAVSVDLAGSYAATDISSTLSGCSALNVPFPGVVYDPSSRNFMLYPGTGDTVYNFNPDTGTCAAITSSGGPSASVGQGTFGHWSYFPTLKKFVNVISVSTNAFAWSGLGGLTSSGSVRFSGSIHIED